LRGTPTPRQTGRHTSPHGRHITHGNKHQQQAPATNSIDIPVAVLKPQFASDGIDTMPPYYRCGPIPFVCLMIGTVWGTIYMNGGTLVAATFASLLTCSVGMLGATAWRICWTSWDDMRVHVSNEMIDEIDETPTLGVVSGAGSNVVLGRPVDDSTLRPPTVINMPPVVVGRPMIGHAPSLRAAGVA
jgi:hypothetical protein